MGLKLTEKEIQTQILEYLEMKRIFHWRQNTGCSVYENKGKKRFVRYGSPGVSDILGIYNGQMFAIEVKSATGRLSIEQKNFLSNIEDNGGMSIVARSLDEVMEVIK